MTNPQGLFVSGDGIKIRIPNREELIFAYPPAGPGSYVDIREYLERQGLYVSRGPETLHLIHGAWQNPEGKYERKILDILKNSDLQISHGILYVPKKVPMW